MVILIVEEGGKSRGFRIGEGRLSVGSGASAAVSLAAADVAEHHLDLVHKEGQVVIEPKPGVMPPELDGELVKQGGLLLPGSVLMVGSAKLSLKSDAASVTPVAVGAGQAPAQGPNKSKAASADSNSSPQSGPLSERGARAAKVATRARKKSVVNKRARSSGGGLPPMLVVSLILVGVGVVGMMIAQSFKSGAEEASKTVTQINLETAERQLEIGNLEAANAALVKLGNGSTLEPKERVLLAQMRSQVAEIEADRLKREQAKVGDEYLDVVLKSYAEKHLGGKPESHVVRVFFDRCAEFKRRWPGHPGEAWINRQRERLKGFVDMSAPLTWADINWQAQVHTNAKPRDYRAAFKLIDDFLGTAEEDERRRLSILRAELEVERDQYHTDQLKHARNLFTKGEQGLSVFWLVQSITGLGDEDMENEAAVVLLGFPEVEGHLMGYRRSKPDLWEKLLLNERVAAFARDKGLIE